MENGTIKEQFFNLKFLKQSHFYLQGDPTSSIQLKNWPLNDQILLKINDYKKDQNWSRMVQNWYQMVQLV